MATLNDFKLVNKKALKYSQYIPIKKQIDDKARKRLGFYILILESITGIKDVDEISDCIIDTQFCKLVFDIDNDDKGIDAVTIDETNKCINLYNFKFREKFKIESGQDLSNAVDSMKFLTYITTENTQELTEKTKNKVDKILELLNSDEIWTINLYMVSNESKPLPTNDSFLKEFTSFYDVNIECITLDKIVNFISERPMDINADIVLDASSVMIYEEYDLSSSKSYLVAMSIIDLIRITCKNPELRRYYNLSEFSKLKDVQLDQGVLFDNVRGYLGETKFNNNILKTLENEPTKFFMYNNGITMTTKNIVARPQNGNKKLYMQIEGFQIVNGGQTLRSIYKQKSINFDENKLANARVLIRIFQTEDNSILTNNIAEYTNSQNAISSIDLKSVSNLQIQIELALKESDILYVRKVGDTGVEEKNYKYRISMERMAQIIYSKLGYPDRATNQKKRLFDSYYDEIFNEELDYELLVEYVHEYYNVKDKYDELKIKGYDQKYFYVLYLNSINYDIIYNINLVEESLMEYRENENLSHARKLIQKGFKEFLNNKIKK